MGGRSKTRIFDDFGTSKRGPENDGGEEKKTISERKTRGGRRNIGLAFIVCESFVELSLPVRLSRSSRTGRESVGTGADSRPHRGTCTAPILMKKNPHRPDSMFRDQKACQTYINVMDPSLTGSHKT